jgi:hypothetical protein
MRGLAASPEYELVALMRRAAAIAALFVIALTTADPDLWGHVRFGQDIINHGSIASHDPYSFTSDRPWVNHEWLSEVLMAAAYRVGGATGLVVLKTIVVVAALVIVSLALRRVAWRPVDHDALVGLAVLATLPRTHHLRPQVFSVLLAAVLLFLLTAADRGSKRALFAVPVVMIAWTNLHGGWLVGLAVLSIWIVVRLIQRRPEGLKRRWLVGLWLASIAATLVNPYGTGLWTFLRETVGLSRPGIFDWLPLLELPSLLIISAAMVAVTAVVALAKAGRGADPAYVLIVVALAVGTLRIGRIDAFFALAVVMLLGPYLGRTRAARWDAPRRAAPPAARRALVLGVTLAMGIATATAARSNLRCIDVSGEPEPEATTFIARHAPRANVLTFFGWGEYALWQLGPGVKISMDGRRETVYSDRLFQDHVRLYEDEPNATALVRRLKPDLIWLPARKHVVATLEREGWHAVFRGPTSVILDDDSTAATVRVRRASRARRCFPDL